MKNIIFIIGSALLVLNLLLGLVISAYHPFNMWMNCIVVIINIILVYLASIVKLKDAFRISMLLLFPILGFVEFLCGFFVAPKWEDNFLIVLVLIMLFVQTLLLTAANYVSKKIN